MLFMVRSDYTVKIDMYWTQDRANAVQLIRYTGHLKTIEKNHVTRQDDWSRGRNTLPEHPEKYPLHRDVYLADKKMLLSQFIEMYSSILKIDINGQLSVVLLLFTCQPHGTWALYVTVSLSHGSWK